MNEFNVGDTVKEIEWQGQFARGATLYVREVKADGTIGISSSMTSPEILYSDSNDLVNTNCLQIPAPDQLFGLFTRR